MRAVARNCSILELQSIYQNRFNKTTFRHLKFGLSKIIWDDHQHQIEIEVQSLWDIFMSLTSRIMMMMEAKIASELLDFDSELARLLVAFKSDKHRSLFAKSHQVNSG
jgi:hypothetical protein